MDRRYQSADWQYATRGIFINGFDTKSARKLESIVKELNESDMEIELDTKELFYQKFVSMNDYINIVNFVGIENNLE